MATFRSDISDWKRYEDVLSNVRNALPNAQRKFWNQVGDEYITVFLDRIAANASIWTSTYIQSLVRRITEDNGQVGLVVELVPEGEQAHRLPIYWKVLEGGAVANPRIPKQALIEWSIAKTGSPGLGMAIVNANRYAGRGIQANPILSSIFNFDGSWNAIGLTPQGEGILSRASQTMMKGLEQVFYRSGPKVGQVRQTVRRDALGRFAPL